MILRPKLCNLLLGLGLQLRSDWIRSWCFNSNQKNFQNWICCSNFNSKMFGSNWTNIFGTFRYLTFFFLEFTKLVLLWNVWNSKLKSRVWLMKIIKLVYHLSNPTQFWYLPSIFYFSTGMWIDVIIDCEYQISIRFQMPDTNVIVWICQVLK